MLFGKTIAVYCEKHTEHTNTLCGERERKKVGEVVRDTTLGEGGARNYIFGFQGSQAVPACPSGIGNAYYRNFKIYIYIYIY
jgi:hypothetical protein